MSSLRSGIDVALRVAAVAVASVVVGGSSCGPGDAGLDPSIPVVFHVQVRSTDPNKLWDLRLGAEDAAALGVEPLIEGEQGNFSIPTPYVDHDTREYFHCLVGSADVVERTTGSTVVAIPADTCLGRGTLVVPTPTAPSFDASPELYSPDSGRSAAVVTVAGQLVVNIDGCATIGGLRARWPVGTAIDDTGTVILVDGRTFANGATITVEMRGPSTPVNESNNPCPGITASMVDDGG